MDRDQVLRVAKILLPGDVDVLAEVVSYCGGFSGDGFKYRLVGTLDRMQDHKRCTRLHSVVKRLTEDEILWLCQNWEPPPTIDPPRRRAKAR